MRLLPNPARLRVDINGRTYIGTVDEVFENVPDHDGKILSANGWTVVDQLPAVVDDGNLRWDDLRFPAQSINPAGTTAPPSVVTDENGYTGCLSFAGNADNAISGVAQMPHAWARGTAIKPHLHWTKPTGSASVVTWELYYRVLGSPGDAAGAWTGPLTATIVAGNQQVSNQHLLASFGEISMTGLKESACIGWRMYRRGSTDADNNAVVLTEFDIHYQADKNGTVEEIPS